MSRTKLLTVLLLLAAASVPAMAQPTPNHRVCLNVRDIDGTDSKDGKILTFRMRDGTIRNNHLQQTCNGLVFGGFSWVVRGGSDEICEESQTLRVLQTGEICTLGKFDPAVKPAARKP